MKILIGLIGITLGLAGFGSFLYAQDVVEGLRGEDSLEVVYRIPPPEISLLADGYTSVNLPGEGFQQVFNLPGTPVLPARSVRLLLPPDREVLEVEVIPGKKIELEGKYQVEFARVPRPISSTLVGKDETRPAAEIYDSSAPYPSALLFPYSIQYLRGYPILTTLLNPVEYIPSEGRLSYYESLTLRVKHGESRKTQGELTRIMPRRGLPADMEKVKGAVDNPGGMF